MRYSSRALWGGLFVVALAAFGLAIPSTASATQAMPSTIRVGRSCSCKSCSTVVTVSMETYAKRVLGNEWITSWNAESLKAGAVAIRTYGAYYVYHPVSGSFDICDNTCCQVYGTTQYTSTDNACNATANQYMMDVNNNFGFAEYSAENNDSTGADGCGNCYTSNKPNDGQCLYDSVCCGTTQNGHGQGMCQWGSQRWAANQAKTYSWILSHYYAAYSYTLKTLGGGGGGSTIIVDNANSGFSCSANWSTGTSSTDKYGADYRYRSTAAVSDPANFSANITIAGTYDISAWWPAGSNRAPSAGFVLPDGASVSKNQQTNGGMWNLLGSKSLTTGAKVTKVSCWTTSGYVVMADAVKYYKP